VEELSRRLVKVGHAEGRNSSGYSDRVTGEAQTMPVRTALGSDLSELLRLYRQLQPDDPELGAAAAASALDVILTAPGMKLLVLPRGERLAATTYLNVVPNLTRSASPYAVVENVVVDEPLRGTGIGKLIIAATLQAAWDAGCYKAMLFTGSRCAATHGFYRACGFVGDDKTAYVARP